MSCPISIEETVPKTPLWTLEQAQSLINDLEPELRKIGWVTALTGGVLFKGQSYNDLDLAFYPFDHGHFPDEQRSRPGLFDCLRAAGFQETADYSSMCDASGHTWQGKRVDVFVFTFAQCLVALPPAHHNP